jgi:hypothetical protein
MTSKTNLEEFRLEMGTYRRSADEDSKSLKDPQLTLERLRSLYGKLDSAERQMADQVLAEWALSEDEAIRFDALALIGDLKICAAMPALQTLAARLALQAAPGSPYEFKKVRRIIARLTG